MTGASWLIPEQFPSLAPAAVHVWSLWLAAPPLTSERLWPLLSEDEQQRVGWLRQPASREQFVLCRGLLRALLAGYSKARAEAIEFCYGPQGKPELLSPPLNIQFNLSHSRQMALFAFSREREVGIDLEEIRPMPDSSAIVERFFSAAERGQWRMLPPAERNSAFFRLWTCKEAYLKARGLGIATALDSFDVVFGQQGSKDGRLSPAPGWSLLELDPAPGFVAAVAAAGNDWQLESFALVPGMTLFDLA